MEEWETFDVRTIVVDDMCRRVQNKRSKDFKPQSLEAYKRRFGQAMKMFLEFANDPSSWKAPSQGRAARRETKQMANSNGETPVPTPERAASPPALMAGLVEYPFPLREGRLAYLKLPVDLKLAKVKRLNAYLNTLAVDAEAA